MGLDKKEILKLANLAKLELSPAEVDQYQRQLGDVLGYVDKLKELNLATTEASLTGVELGQHQLRSDQVQPSMPETINQAADLSDGYVVSPGVFKK